MMPAACRILDADGMVVSADHRDAATGYDMIVAKCDSLLNPSIHHIRQAALPVLDALSDVITGHDTVIILANLAGRSGAALAPLTASLCRSVGARILSVVIMPFGYEKDRMFYSAVSLQRLRRHSDSVMVLDNDSMLQSNPQMNPQQCYDIGREAILRILRSLGGAALPPEGIICAGFGESGPDGPLRRSLNTLYGTTTPSSVSRSILYVDGDMSAGDIQATSRMTESVTGSPVEVAVTGATGRHVVLVSASETLAKFDAYDPLHNIPQMDVQDVDECDRALSTDLGLYNIE